MSGYKFKDLYNDQGIRTEKTVNGVTTKYYLLGDKVILETNGTDTIHYSYDSQDNLVSMKLNGVEYYYVRNGQGDVIALIDGQGNEVVTYTYDSWGNVISINGSLKDTVGIKNPYRYRGYRYDEDTKLYYLQSRFYNPEWGRFVNADAIAGGIGELLGHNLFAYCKNNPETLKDPAGFRPMDAVSLIEETQEMKDASFQAMNRNLKKNKRIVQKSAYMKKIYNGKRTATLNVGKVYGQKSKIGGTGGISGSEFYMPLNNGLSANQKLLNIEGSFGLESPAALKIGIQGSVYKLELSSTTISIFNVDVTFKGEVAVFSAGAKFQLGFRPNDEFIIEGFVGAGELGGGISVDIDW